MAFVRRDLLSLHSRAGLLDHRRPLGDLRLEKRGIGLRRSALRLDAMTAELGTHVRHVQDAADLGVQFRDDIARSRRGREQAPPKARLEIRVARLYERWYLGC